MRSSQRIDVGPPIAILGALMLLVSLFVDWYEPGITGWTVFEALDLLLAGLALACLLGATSRMGLELPGGRPLRARFAAAGALALVLVVSQVINHPPAAVGEDPEVGLWLAVGGAGMLAVGGLLSVTRISFAVDVEERARTQAPPPAPPAATPPRAGAQPVGGEAETTPLDPPPGSQERR